MFARAGRSQLMAGQVTLQNRTWFLPQVAGDSCRVVKYQVDSAQKFKKGQTGVPCTPSRSVHAEKYGIV
jgi:hypothetical protein